MRSRQDNGMKRKRILIITLQKSHSFFFILIKNFLFFIFLATPHGLWDLSSQNLCPPAVEAQSPNRWTARELPRKVTLSGSLLALQLGVAQNHPWSAFKIELVTVVAVAFWGLSCPILSGPKGDIFISLFGSLWWWVSLLWVSLLWRWANGLQGSRACLLGPHWGLQRVRRRWTWSSSQGGLCRSQ